MDSLTQLAIKYGADKWGKHNYTPYYNSLFIKKRLKVRKVIEMGAGEGASLRMWRDYFPNAFIYGADNQDNRIFKEDRIEVIKCDQSSLDDVIGLMNKTGTDIDIFIDDGSHVPEHQIFTCRAVMYIADKTIDYFIEDVADETIINELGEYRTKTCKFSKRYDDIIIRIRHV